MAVIRYHNEKRIQPLFDKNGQLVYFLSHTVWVYQDEIHHDNTFTANATLLYENAQGVIVAEQKIDSRFGLGGIGIEVEVDFSKIGRSTAS